MAKSLTRQQQKKAAAAKKGLAEYAAEDPLAKKIASRTWITDEFRQIYNKCCPKCQQLIRRTGGQANFTDYCLACQQAARPHLQNVQTMLGRSKE